MIQKKYNIKQPKSKFHDDDLEDLDLIENDVGIHDDEEEEIEEDYYPSAKEDEDIEDLLDSSKKYAHKLKAREIIQTTPTVTASGPKKRGPKPNKQQFYVEPKEFDESITQYYNTNIISDELATMINKIAHKLSYAPNFINYTYRDEMVGDAVVRMMKALIAKKYTHSKGYNPFSYFTKIAFNAFRNRIKREKYMHETLQKYQEEIIMNSEYNNFVKNKKKYNNDETLIVEND
jgi:hypothetical protein